MTESQLLGELPLVGICNIVTWQRELSALSLVIAPTPGPQSRALCGNVGALSIANSTLLN